MKISVQTYAAMPPNPADPSKAEVAMVWSVHVANRSSARVEVQRVHVIPWSLKYTILFGNRLADALALLPLFLMDTEVAWLEGEDKKTLEPFSGAQWLLTERMSNTPLPKGRFKGRFSYLRLRVVLTNGQVAYSGLRRRDFFARMNAAIERTREARQLSYARAHGQLSFDDLLKESQNEPEPDQSA